MATIADGTFTAPVQDGARRPSYPFGNAAIPDVYPVVYDRNMVVYSASYSPQMAARTSVTNLLTRSDQFDDATWSKTNVTASANVATNPNDGSATADSILETVTNGAHAIAQAFTFSAVAYTFTIYAKPAGRSWLRVQVEGGAGFYDITNGIVGTTGGGVTASILSVGNGWYRIKHQYVASAGAAFVTLNISTDGATTSYAGDTSKGVYLWGGQLETGSADSAYIATTTVSRTGSTPNIELNETTQGSDPFAFLVSESEMQTNGPCGMFSRRYARIPGDQITPGNQMVGRPVMHNIKSGTSYAVSFDDRQKYSWVFTSRKSVTRVSSVDAKTITAAMPSGNITFVEGGRTLNIAANSTKAAFEAGFSGTLTGLSNVAVTVSSGQVQITWTGTMTSVTPPSGAQVMQFAPTWFVTLISTGTQTIPATTTFDAASHGGVVGDRVALWSEDNLVGTGTVVTVPNSGSFTVMTSDLNAANTLVTHCAFSSDAATCYVNGYKLCTVRRTKKFYLPGVTTGITTYADIPDVTVYTDPVAWLGRLVAGSTYAAIAVSDLEQWMGPILMQETSEVQMSDAIDTVTP
jgi:hypothetical protein